jgi:hypothetical protein
MNRRTYLLAFATFALGLLVGLLTPRAGAVSEWEVVRQRQRGKVAAAQAVYQAQPRTWAGVWGYADAVTRLWEIERAYALPPTADLTPAFDLLEECRTLARTEREQRLTTALYERLTREPKGEE